MAEEKQKPLTREDVLKRIEENGGTAEGLDLSGKVFEEGIDLSNLCLNGIILKDTELVKANFNGTNLDEAVMKGANLRYATFNPLGSKVASLTSVDLRQAYLHDAEFRQAVLFGAIFEGELPQLAPAWLENTDFRGANLFIAKFTGCYFDGTKLEGAFIGGTDITEAQLEYADWGNYIIGEEKQKKDSQFAAVHIYRRLKIWYTEHGIYDVAGEFFFREMEAKRKNLRWLQPKERRWLGWWPLRGQKVRLNVYKWLHGYGERPWRVVAWGGLVLFGLALIYFFLRGVAPYTLTIEAFLSSLYYSAVSFTALGYGPWFSTSSVRGWVQGIGAAEAIVGVFTIALFLVTFVRKMTR